MKSSASPWRFTAIDSRSNLKLFVTKLKMPYCVLLLSFFYCEQKVTLCSLLFRVYHNSVSYDEKQLPALFFWVHTRKMLVPDSQFVQTNISTNCFPYFAVILEREKHTHLYSYFSWCHTWSNQLCPRDSKLNFNTFSTKCNIF